MKFAEEVLPIGFSVGFIIERNSQVFRGERASLKANNFGDVSLDGQRGIEEEDCGVVKVDGGTRGI